MSRFQNHAFQAFIYRDFKRALILYLFSGSIGHEDSLLSAAYIMENNYLEDI